jgi:hypothetical protein
MIVFFHDRQQALGQITVAKAQMIRSPAHAI